MPATHMKPAPKITSSHSSMIDVAEDMVRGAALKDPHATRISLGIIEKTNRGVQGKFRIKFTDINGGILMKVRGNLFVQEVQVYTDNVQETRENLVRYALTRRYQVNFTEPAQAKRSDR
ncbi:MAG: DUF2103 domain-containing protein [bacterium]|nr:DUF2103 domain-containing protein [bacterium]